jgi:probable phosphoglycerate mutase
VHPRSPEWALALLWLSSWLPPSRTSGPTDKASTQAHVKTYEPRLQTPGKPRLVSVLVYLNSSWPLNFGAETLFLDSASDTGIAVRPRPGRLIIMDQDIMHRVNAASPAATHPRYSLVWKLMVLHKSKGVAPCFLLDSGGPPVAFGSANKMKLAQELVK